MNEEKKLSKILDEIFGKFINNETENIGKIEYIGQSYNNPAPQIDINNLIENLFLSKDIIFDNGFTFNRMPITEFITPVVPPGMKIFPE